MNYFVQKLSKTILFTALPLAVLAGVFGLSDKVYAASTYDSLTNTICLGLGNNTLNSIYTDIN